MKTISLWEPWASLISQGHKKIETRSWSTPYRGAIAIHAARRWERDQQTTVMFEPFLSALGPNWKPALGKIVAIADLYDCQRMTKDICLEKECDALSVNADLEWHWGDYQPGRYMWMLRHVVRLNEPIPARGMQGLWHWDCPAELLGAMPKAETITCVQLELLEAATA